MNVLQEKKKHYIQQGQINRGNSINLQRPPQRKIYQRAIEGNWFQPTANEKNIYKILVSLNPKKAEGNDLIPSKVVIKSSEILAKTPNRCDKCNDI